MMDLQLGLYRFRLIVGVQDCTWRSGTCFGTSTDLIFVQMIFLIFLFSFSFWSEGQEHGRRKTRWTKVRGVPPLTADPHSREILAACTKTQRPFLRGHPKRLAAPCQVRVSTPGLPWLTQALG